MGKSSCAYVVPRSPRSPTLGNSFSVFTAVGQSTAATILLFLLLLGSRPPVQLRSVVVDGSWFRQSHMQQNRAIFIPIQSSCLRDAMPCIAMPPRGVPGSLHYFGRIPGCDSLVQWHTNKFATDCAARLCGHVTQLGHLIILGLSTNEEF